MFISRQPTPFCGLAPTSHPSDPKHIACPYNYTHNDCSADSREVVTRHPATPQRGAELATRWKLMKFDALTFALNSFLAAGQLSNFAAAAVVVVVDVVVACNWLYISTPRRQQNRTDSNSDSQQEQQQQCDNELTLHTRIGLIAHRKIWRDAPRIKRPKRKQIESWK